MNPPWDPRMANDAAVIDQCMKLGGRVLEKPRLSGFSLPRVSLDSQADASEVPPRSEGKRVESPRVEPS